ncbi:MAG: UDP-N-acetylmuramoyl-L-alanine--D-glutamate ligase [Gemmatimonadales bacterium]|nr:UDP-N-acetylmuramoyl-L-alanine--D-glutamate ligase [Gemmatimonadales bacterium]NIN50008.1 UDP-N-acetylmuramoyl-L-alanine--D-glutamate ligase [Gemmatimonadales bacterium]NIP07472.1 UDP-N-acetylmuramoyl-L-alanine--D-glutamate ligase [Gemmatimonadales bacterium]NIR03111.1 UDP-N-acetylmuramoyl-L-alanine--D-glutamate ligase [Gemmatimonadales bacterium]NIS66823.1 UDP-N-acetylmuramoyl-L-alanine--D-glutamate ligase [Gemmatimonadales bacterium]
MAAGKWLATHGLRVYASDLADTPALREAAAMLREAGVAVELGGHDVGRIRRAAVVVVSPGVPPDALPVVAAREAGVAIVSELDLGVRILEGSRLLVVTGTNGKTTTTALLAHVLREAGLRAVAAGNIGRPLVDLASDSPAPDWIAVEVSSFQLHDSPHLAPAVGVVTNLAPDHLDRYPSVEAYYADKRLLFQNATDDSVWVLNGDDAAVLELAHGAPGSHRHWSLRARSDGWFDRDREALMLGGRALLPRSEFPLLGDHNVANALAAVLAAAAVGAKPTEIAAALASFRPPPHRLEPVRTINDVLWINDSKATNVSAASVALQAMARPFVLILGGRHKGEPYTALAPLLRDRCRTVVAYGEAAALVSEQLGGAVPVEVKTAFDDAMYRAAELAMPGDAVLLSPACASFDQFGNFEERGDRFRALVEGM